jgi:hypothetical protein
VDTIFDADGNGTIELDGEALRGTMQGGNGEWQSADRNLKFTLAGDLATGGTLMISSFADSAGQVQGVPKGTVTIDNWKNGDLGITLAGDALDGASDTSPQDEGSPAPAPSTADLTSDTLEDQDVLSLDGSGSVSTDVAPEHDGPVAADNGSSEAFYDGEGAIEASVDLDAALESLLGNTNPTFAAVDPNSYEQAMQAFSGVLAPPDVPATFANSSFDVGAVTEAAMADAIAADYSSDAFDAFEQVNAQLIPSIDVASLMETKQRGMELRRSAGG